MIISYPVLLASAPNQSEDSALDAQLGQEMTEQDHFLAQLALEMDEGIYPVSFGGQWHGGIHLFVSGSIHAIADGEIVAFRLAASPEQYEGVGHFDTSFVLIKHKTETGEDTEVEFYSLYMHLKSHGQLTPAQRQQLPPALRNATPGPTVVRPPAQQAKIYRKDILGWSGKLYDRHSLHFEIFCTDAALAKFWSDSKTLTEGRPGAYGDMHFVIPANQTFNARHPNAPNGVLDLSGPQDFPMPVLQGGTNDKALYVSVRLARGKRITTTYIETGPNRYEPLGEPYEHPGDYEYELYRLACALYPDCPSAGYEWLRFGRVLGPDRTTNNTNWQAIPFADGKVGYIDLAPAHIVKLSDADFPYWQGWSKVDEGTALNATDGLCDAQELLWLAGSWDFNQDGKRDEQDLRGFYRFATDPAVRARLRHLVCKHPSEWDGSNLAAKFARLRAPGEPLEHDEDWQRFEQHAKKLTFWTEAGLGEPSVWHFHPLQFIRHMRGCGWLAEKEMVQLIPTNIIRHAGNNYYWEQPAIQPARLTIRTHRLDLNKALRKFCITTPIRMAAFYGNATQETMWFSDLRENSGTTPQLHVGWYGRGFLQLTNPSGNINMGNNNYYKYFRFRGRIPHVPPGQDEIAWRNQLASDSYDAAHSATAYWVWPDGVKRNSNSYLDVAASNERRVVQTNAGERVYYFNESFRRAAASVNSPGAINNPNGSFNGFVDRSSAFLNALMVLGDVLLFRADTGATTTNPENFVPRRP